MNRQLIHKTGRTHVVTGGLATLLLSVLVVQNINMTARG